MCKSHRLNTYVRCRFVTRTTLSLCALSIKQTVLKLNLHKQEKNTQQMRWKHHFKGTLHYFAATHPHRWIPSIPEPLQCASNSIPVHSPSRAVADAAREGRLLAKCVIASFEEGFEYEKKGGINSTRVVIQRGFFCLAMARVSLKLIYSA